MLASGLGTCGYFNSLSTLSMDFLLGKINLLSNIVLLQLLVIYVISY